MTQKPNLSPLVHLKCSVKKDLDSITAGGAFLDETLSFKQYVAARAKLALYGIHLIKNVRNYLTIATTKMLMCALVLS